MMQNKKYIRIAVTENMIKREERKKTGRGHLKKGWILELVLFLEKSPSPLSPSSPECELLELLHWGAEFLQNDR